MKKLSLIDTGKKKQHEIDNLSKKKIREIPEGKEKQKEVDNVSKKKIRETSEGKTKGNGKFIKEKNQRNT